MRMLYWQLKLHSKTGNQKHKNKILQYEEGVTPLRRQDMAARAARCLAPHLVGPSIARNSRERKNLRKTFLIQLIKEKLIARSNNFRIWRSCDFRVLGAIINFTQDKLDRI